MVTLLIAKFVTFTCNSRRRCMWSRCKFVKVWNADHVVEL